MSSLKSILNPEQPVGVASRPRKATSQSRSPPSRHSSLLSGTPTPEPLQHSRPNIPEIDHPPHPDCPDTLDCLPDTNERPQHTLPVILRCAILGSPKQRLTIRDIYAAMEEKYPYYRTAGQTWKQSVRHHLSLNRLFERQPRPVADPGFGSYWTVNLSAPPGTKRPRKRGRPNKDEGQIEAKLKKRGRPRKIQISKVEPELDHPPIATLSMPFIDPPQPGCSASAVSAFHGSDDEDDLLDGEVNVEDVPLLDTDDEAFESDEDMQDNLSKQTSPIDTHALPSGARIPNEWSTMSSLNSAGPANDIVERLQSENAELRRQSTIASSVSARLSEQLAEAQLDVTNSRFEKEILERKLEAEISRRIRAETALAELRRSNT